MDEKKIARINELAHKAKAEGLTAEETADFLSTLSNVERIDVLPYHSMGVYKWKELGLPYALEGVETPSKERVENAKSILSRALNK